MSSRPTTPAPVLPERLSSLDGLRGVAAVVVLIHHALLTVPFLARAYYPDLPPVPPGTLAWYLTYTPLHLLWGGTEAVFLFFILSGLVVTLPALRSPGFDWVAFYPRRIVRIYGPVAVALLLGVALALAVPRHNERILGHWMNTRPNHVTPADLLGDLMLVDGTSGIISPLWSLQWEILFSAFLPLFVGIAVIGRRRPLAVLAALAVCLGLGSFFGANAMFYLALFAVGAVVVVLWDVLVVVARVVSRRAWAWPVLVAVGLLLASAVWWLQGLGLSQHRADMLQCVAIPGIVLLLLAAAFWRPAVGLLNTRLFQWLGRISFSLYLVHEPIVIAARFLLVQVQAPTWVSIAVSIPVAFGVAALFTRFVEAPFHRLARTAGKRVAAASRDFVQPNRTWHEAAATTGAIPVAARKPSEQREPVGV
ncbi:acyltransferase family protein [uncultured Amnibacterium sp.]|uniref:acyltransferase family protein n=1 Tax=uncultured Amnibacterium sp. TaxID=1631851 RepID=UPI0035CBF241